MRMFFSIIIATMILAWIDAPTIISKAVHEVQRMNTEILPAAIRAAEGR